MRSDGTEVTSQSGARPCPKNRNNNNKKKKLPASSRLSIRSEKVSIRTATALQEASATQQARGAQLSLKLCRQHSSVRTGRCWVTLHQAAGPRDDGQGDSAAELLQKAHQCRVGHPPCALPVNLKQDVAAPAQRGKDDVKKLCCVEKNRIQNVQSPQSCTMYVYIICTV